jgi:hypothetical protein
MSLISPGLALSVLLATAIGAAFHLWRGGGYGMLVRYLLAAWGGFALGQLAGWLGGWELAMVGQVHMLEGTLGSGLVLVIVHWLTASSSPAKR